MDSHGFSSLEGCNLSSSCKGLWFRPVSELNVLNQLLKALRHMLLASTTIHARAIGSYYSFASEGPITAWQALAIPHFCIIVALSSKMKSVWQIPWQRERWTLIVCVARTSPVFQARIYHLFPHRPHGCFSLHLRRRQVRTRSADRFMDWWLIHMEGSDVRKMLRLKSPEKTQTARLSHRSRASDKLRVPGQRNWNWQSPTG